MKNKNILWLMALCAFAINTTEFGIVGILPQLAENFGVTIDKAGWLVSAFALSVAVSGPILTGFIGKLNKKSVLSFILVIYTISNLIPIFIQSYAVAIAFRIIPAILLPIFWAISITTAVSLVDPSKKGSAVATVFSGLSIAAVLGVPLGSYITSLFTWEAAFYFMAALNVISLLFLFIIFPNIRTENPANASSQWGEIMNVKVWLGLASNMMLIAGMFATYSYMTAYFQQELNMSQGLSSIMLFAFGFTGVIGNSWAGRELNKNVLRTSNLVTVGIALIIMLLFLIRSELWMALPFVMVWGFIHTAGFVVTQVRAVSLVSSDNQLINSMNVSICNIGIALGTYLGGEAISQWGLGSIGFAGAALLVSSLIIGTFIKQKQKENMTVSATA